MNKRLFAIADIHGCFDQLKELVENKIQLQKEDKLILLGDYIDRGDKSKEVVDFIIELQQKAFDVIPLMGNHEAMLIDAIKNDKDNSIWVLTGGNKTLDSFNINSVKEIELKYIKFFSNLKYYYAFEEYLFVHAGFNDTITNPFTDYNSMLWECKDSYTNLLLTNKTIIHGHNPIKVSRCEERIHSNNRVINIDTGCVYTTKDGYGRLTAYNCEDRRIHFA